MSADADSQLTKLISNFEHTGKRELLRFLNDQVLREQEIFWQRFYSFATLHAGAFVLMTSPSVPPIGVAFAGIVLGVSWVYIQWASLHYADRAKSLYHQLREETGVFFDESSLFARSFGRRHRVSSTDVGLGVAIFVCFVWIVILVYLLVVYRLKANP